MADLIIGTDITTFLGISNPTAIQTALAGALAPAIHDAVQNWCDRTFEVPDSDYEELVDGRGTDVIMIRHYPIVSIEEINYYDAINDVETLVQSTDYMSDDANSREWDIGQIRMHGCGVWARGRNNIKVEYKGGYATDNIPKDIILACKIWASIIFNEVDKELFGMPQSQIADQSLSFVNPEEMPTRVLGLLKKYRRVDIR